MKIVDLLPLAVGLFAVIVPGCEGDESTDAQVAEAAQAAAGQTCVTVQRGVFGTVEDTRLRGDLPDAVFGARDTFVTGDQFTNRLSLLRFGLDFIPAGMVVDSATVTLSEVSNLGASTIDVHAVTAPWSEDTATWNGFQSAYDPAVATSFSNGGAGHTGPVSFDVTGLVRGVHAGAPNHGLALLATTNSTWASSERAQVASRPALEVCYSPACPDGASCSVPGNPNAPGVCAGNTCTIPPPPPPQNCSGATWGDPHIVTWDGLIYDLQAAGEFVLATDGQGFTVQARFEAAGPNVSSVSAVATRLGGKNLSFSDLESPPLRVDGVPAIVPPEGLFFAGGGRVDALSATSFQISYPGGQAIVVDTIPAIPSRPLSVRACRGNPQQAGGFGGLLGNADGSGANDLTSNGGGTLTAPVSLASLMGFADTWRVTSQSSLFHYAPGTSTATYQNLSFPSVPVSTASLSAGAYASAQSICAAAGVTNARLLDACILDVGITGQAAWASASAAAPLPTFAFDTDADGVLDSQDNCPTVANASQLDANADGTGDACTSCPAGTYDCDKTLANGCESLVPCSRPPTNAVHPTPSTLSASGIPGGSDIVFDANGRAYIPTIISGTDHIYVVGPSGVQSTITGFSNYNIPAIALNPANGLVVVGHNDNSTSSVGVQSGSSIIAKASGTYVAGSAWSNSLLNQCESSIVVGANGCAWTPNFAGNGTLTCVNVNTGVKTPVPGNLGGRIEGIAFSATGTLLVSIGSSIRAVDTATGATTLRFTAPSTILDFAVDYNDDLYISLSGQILRVAGATGTSSVFAVAPGQGKLAISPDGYLVRIVPNPTGFATFQEWALGG